MFQRLELIKRNRRRLLMTWFVGLGFLIAVTIIGVGFLIPIPTFSFVEDIKTNQPLLFESHKKFWVEVDGKKTYSTNVGELQKINLGKLEGKKKYKFGGYIDLGLFKLESNKSQSYNLDRDYSSIETAFEVKRYITKDEPNKNYVVRIAGRDQFVLEDNNGEVYDSNKTSNKCVLTVSTNSTKVLSCPITFINDQAAITVFVKDKIGNKIQLATNEMVSIVPNVNLDCNLDSLITNSIIKCKSNKLATGNVVGNSTNYQFKPYQEVIVKVDLVDGKNNIKINLKDEHELSSVYELKVNAMKQI
jgi:hypothetical protein